MSNPASSQAAPVAVPAESEVEEYRWLILLGLITAAIMEVLDTTIINVGADATDKRAATTL